MSAVFGVEKPKVGLLSNGSEDKKGNALTKEAFELLSESNINFMGNNDSAVDIGKNVARFVRFKFKHDASNTAIRNA